LRLKLTRNGYLPIPLYGKVPPVYGKNNNRGGLAGWEKLEEVNDEQIRMWEKTWPEAINTGGLTRRVPAIDIDILHAEAAQEVENFTHGWFGRRGKVLVRVGQPPKRAILSRTDQPFKKLIRKFVAPDGSKHKIEILGDGQQLVYDGIHPDTKQPYVWHGGDPSTVKRSELPDVTSDEAEKYLDAVSAKLIKSFGFKLDDEKRREQKKDAREEFARTDRETAWAESALRNVAAELSDTAKGDRNNKLYKCAFRMGTMIAREWIARDVVELALEKGAADCRLDADDGGHKGVLATIKSGINAGLKCPHEDLQDEPQQDEPHQKEQKVVDPVDLWAQSRVPPLPRGLLPKVIEEFAFLQGKLMGADPAALVMSALTVCAAAISDNIKLQPKRSDASWFVSTRIWCVLVGEVSAMKTSVTRQAMYPLIRIDTQLRRKYAEAKEAYEALPNDEKKSTPEPVLQRVRIEDVTPEAAQEIFKDNTDGMMLWRDELSGLFGGIDKYGGFKGSHSDRGFWLQAYNGGPYCFDRVKRGSGLVENLGIAILGGTQPDTARRIFADGVDNGMLQRFNPVMARNRVLGSEEEPATSPVHHYEQRVEQLFAASRQYSIHPIQFDSDSAMIRRQLEEKHIKLVETFTVVNKMIASHVGKYDGMFASYCLLWHIIEQPTEKWSANISADVARRVAGFMHNFLLPHAIAFYRSTFGLADEHDRITAVAGFILAHKLERLTNRDIQMSVRSMRNCDRRDIESVFNQLDTFGWVTRVPGRRFTDPPSWIVNPSVHEKFKEHAEWEREYRQEAQRLMAETISSEIGVIEIA